MRGRVSALAVGGEELVHRAHLGGAVSEADVAAAEVAAAEVAAAANVPAAGVTARVARVPLSTVTLGGGLVTAELREQRLGDQAAGEGRREAAEQGAAHAAAHASATTEGSL